MKLKTISVRILGTAYDVIIGQNDRDDPDLENRMGYCMPVRQRIVAADPDTIDGWKDESEEAKARCLATTLRHEVIHAFLAESGLWSNSMGADAWAMNEEMIDWLAMQWPKINACMGGHRLQGQRVRREQLNRIDAK